MRGDNQGAIALTKNPHLHDRSKHIDVCYHHIRDLVQKKKLAIIYIPTAEMPADGPTKPLRRVAFERFKNLIGIPVVQEINTYSLSLSLFSSINARIEGDH